MRKVRAVFSLYSEHSLFWTLVIMTAGTMAAASFASHHHQYWGWLEDLSTLWHLFWVCLAFFFGILIKRQMASPFAHMLPGYKSAHIWLALGLWILFAVVTVAWLFTMPKILVAPEKGPMEMLCVLTFLVTLMLAYLSIRPVFLICYAVVLVAYANVMNIYDFIVRMEGGIGWLTVLILALGSILVWRLFMLREGMLEYPFLFSWPPHRSMVGDMGWGRPEFRGMLVTPYYRREGLIQKSLHWANLEREGMFGLAVFILLGAAAFELFVVHFGSPEGFYARPFANFLVLMMFPVFLTLAFTYRILAYGEYALLRPLRREDLFRQWGCLLALNLLVAWLLVVTVFAVMPAFLMGLPFARTGRFWWYLLFSGVFAQMTMAFLAYLASVKSRKSATVHCLLYLCWLSVVLTGANYWDAPVILALVFVSTAVGIMYGAVAFRKWCREEVF